MNVFVTGATGLIGRGVVTALKDAGHHPIGLTGRPENRAFLEGLGAVAVVGDLGERVTWLDHARAADAVIHCAKPRFKRLNEKVAQQWADAELYWVEQLIAAARDGNKPLIYTSGAWLYGPGRDRRTESAPLNPFPHIAHKARGERMVLDAARSNDVRGVVLRAGMVYAPWGQFAEQYLRTMAKGGAARYAGSGANVQSWIYVDDLARVYVRAIEQAPSGRIFNVADDEPVAVATLLETVAEAFGAKKPAGVPRPLITLLLGGTLARAVMSDSACSNDSVKADLGIALTYPTYREGAKRVAEAYAAIGPLRKRADARSGGRSSNRGLDS
jgi:nucleoside-diphosphate-sugar epimerase